MESTISSEIATIGAEGIKGNQLFDLSYWFGYPGTSSLFGLISPLILGILLLMAGAITLIIAHRGSSTPPKRKFFIKMGWCSASLGLAALTLVLFRFLGLVFLSVRFGWVLWVVTLGFIAYILFREYSTKLPTQQVQYQSYLLKKKYLPAKKRKR